MFKLKSRKYVRKSDIIEYGLRYQIMKLVHGYGLLYVSYKEFVWKFESCEFVFNLTLKLIAILLRSFYPSGLSAHILIQIF